MANSTIYPSEGGFSTIDSGYTSGSDYTIYSNHGTSSTVISFEDIMQASLNELDKENVPEKKNTNEKKKDVWLDSMYPAPKRVKRRPKKRICTC